MLNEAQWEKLIARWSEAIPSNHRNLVIHCIAKAIVEDVQYTKSTGFLYTPRFASWCVAVGVDPQFLVEQVHKAALYALNHPAGPILKFRKPPQPAKANRTTPRKPKGSDTQ